uniref:Alpha/beta superfamily hydrolase n=1 Tax=Hirondellea gigas TaxID=1518452 RepID=A0A6A7G9Q5_9CRUS
MQQYIKDHSFVNRLLFPAPTTQYTANSFPRQLCWIPRNECDRPDSERFGEEPLSNKDDRVPCLWLPYHRPSKRIILYGHGNGEDLGNTHRFIRMLRDNLKCHVLAIEYPGYGINAGVSTETSVNADFTTAFHFVLSDMGFRLEDILLFGRSIGSGPCCQLAARHKVGGLVLVSPFSSIRDMTRHLAGRVAAALVADRFSNIQAIMKVEVPLILIHGLADKLIPYSHSQLLFRAAEKTPRRAIHFPEDMDHNSFNLKDDVLMPIKLHFPTFFVRGTLHHKSIMPPFAFLKPLEFAALRETKRHPAPPKPRRDYSSSLGSSDSPPSNPVSPTPEKKVRSSEFERELAHLMMMYPDLEEAEAEHVLTLCKGNLARAAEVILNLNLVGPGPTGNTTLDTVLHKHLVRKTKSERARKHNAHVQSSSSPVNDESKSFSRHSSSESDFSRRSASPSLSSSSRDKESDTVTLLEKLKLIPSTNSQNASAHEIDNANDASTGSDPPNPARLKKVQANPLDEDSPDANDIDST